MTFYDKERNELTDSWTQVGMKWRQLKPSWKVEFLHKRLTKYKARGGIEYYRLLDRYAWKVSQNGHAVLRGAGINNPFDVYYKGEIIDKKNACPKCLNDMTIKSNKRKMYLEPIERKLRNNEYEIKWGWVATCTPCYKKMRPKIKAAQEYLEIRKLKNQINQEIRIIKNENNR